MDELPNELLLHIFSFIHAPITHFSSPQGFNRSPDLAFLSCVCGRFNQLATPLLYESIERTGDINSLAYRALPDSLLSNPKLRRLVKNIRLKLDDDATVGQPLSVRDKASNAVRIPRLPHLGNRSSHGDDDQFEEVNHEKMLDDAMGRHTWLLDMIETSAAELKLPFQHHWIKNAIRGEDIPLALSILQAPNIERIWFRLPHTYL